MVVTGPGAIPVLNQAGLDWAAAPLPAEAAADAKAEIGRLPR